MFKVVSHIIILISFFNVTLRVYAQQNKVDSLISLIKIDNEDSSKVNHLNLLASNLMYQNPDTSIVLSKQALLIATKINNKPSIALSISNLGVYHWIKADYSNALAFDFKALKLYESQKDKTGTATALGNLGIVYWSQNEYPKALDYLKRALKVNEEIGNKHGVAKNVGNIGVLLLQQGKFLESIDYFQSALKLDDELGSKTRAATDLGNIGVSYHYQGNVTKSNVEMKKFYSKAFEFYVKALTIEEELGNNSQVSRHLGNIGSVCIEMKKFDEAEKYLLKALKLSDSLGVLNEKMGFEYSLSELYELKGDYKKSYEHYQIYAKIKETIFNQEKEKELTKNELTYEFEKKEAITKAEQDKKDAVAAAENKKQKIIIGFTLGGLFLLSLTLIFIVRSLRLARKQKSIIVHQKELVEEKQKEILDSIYYARRIQRSLITSEKYILKKLIYLKNI